MTTQVERDLEWHKGRIAVLERLLTKLSEQARALCDPSLGRDVWLAVGEDKMHAIVATLDECEIAL